jgi:mandelate racemase
MALPTVARAKVRAVNAPLLRPLRTASGVMHSAPLVLVDIETSTGIVGCGYAFAYTPVVLRSLLSLAEDVARLVEGRPLAPRALLEALRVRFRLIGTRGLLDMALAALDVAAWDAHAKTMGLPLVKLLGGEAIDLPAYASFGFDGEDEAVRATAQAAAEGFRAVKIKIGYETLQEDLRVVRAVKRGVGDAVSLLLDYNQSLSVPEALRRCAALDSEGIAWIEEPTRYDDVAGHAKIAAETRTAIQLGENLWGAKDIADSLRANASDLMMPDLIKAGGVSGWLAAGAICQAAGVPVSNHFYQETSAHLMAVTPTAQFVEFFDLAGPILRTPLVAKEGIVRASEEPGLGIEWNEAAVERFAL